MGGAGSGVPAAPDLVRMHLQLTYLPLVDSLTLDTLNSCVITTRAKNQNLFIIPKFPSALGPTSLSV